jgi:hypothetical protein
VGNDPAARLEHARQHVEAIGYEDTAAWHAAWDEVLEAERDLARSRGEPYAEILDLGFQWDVGAPEPHIVSNGMRAFIVCLVGEPDPNWDGTYTTVVSPSDQHDGLFAVIDLWGIQSLRFGMPNDEAIEGHPVWGRGLRAYKAHMVMNSAWLEEHIRWNRVHPSHSDASWRELNHYLLAFHDDTIEVLARGIEARPTRGTMSSLLQSCLDTLISEPFRR